MIEEKTVWFVDGIHFESPERAKKHVDTRAIVTLISEYESYDGLNYEGLLEEADALYLLLGNYLGTNG